MTFISTPESPALFTASAGCYVLLVKHTTEDDSQKRYDLLWGLVSADIIGGPWTYGTKSVEMAEASVEVLAAVLPELGVASVRFLKACIAGGLPPRVLPRVKPNSWIMIGNRTSVIRISHHRTRGANGGTASISQFSMHLCPAAAMQIDRADVSLETQDIRWFVEMLGRNER
jgi:hypothetical protein